ncbi:MAG: alpha/beta hydrolase [Acidobacteriota bacterium]
MTEFEEGFIDVNGNQTWYQLGPANGRPLVFVHGWSMDLTYWRAQVERFAGSFQTLAYDWRGMGKTEGATPEYHMLDLANDLDVLLQKLGLEQPILCGHSEGGAIVLQHAVAHRDQVAGVVQVDTELSSGGVLEHLVGGLLEKELDKLEQGGESSARGSRFDQLILRLALPIMKHSFWSEDFIEAHPEVIAAWEKQWLSNSLVGLVNGLAAWTFRPDLTALLQRLKGPFLNIWGNEDVVIKLSAMQQIQSSLPKASQLNVIDKASHFSMNEQPKQFNEVLGSFLGRTFPDTGS